MATVSDYTQLKSAADIAAASGFGNGKIIGIVESGSLKQYEVGPSNLGSGIQMADGKFANLASTGGGDSFDAQKQAIENASGGRNTLMIDAQGNMNTMVWVSSFLCEDLNAKILDVHGVDLQLGTGLHPAFVRNGVSIPGFWAGKYLASAGVSGGCSVVGGVQPLTSVNYDTAKSLCKNKGSGWHIMSIHEWAAIALWSFANNTVPRGNTNYGRAHDNKIETSRRVDNGTPGDTSGMARTDTGKGPTTWSHDHTEFGVQDLVGNVWEWVGQMKLSDGRIFTTTDNNPDADESTWFGHNAYFDSPNDGQSGNVGAPILSDSVTNRNGPPGDDGSFGYTYSSNWAGIAKSATHVKSLLLRQLLIESENTTNVTGLIGVRNYGERPLIRGGSWYEGSNAGLGALNLNNARSIASGIIGFRPAFFE